jgi:hypothetical protein
MAKIAYHDKHFAVFLVSADAEHVTAIAHVIV